MFSLNIFSYNYLILNTINNIVIINIIINTEHLLMVLFIKLLLHQLPIPTFSISP